MQKRFGISAFWIKLGMAGLMVLDHLCQFLRLGPAWWHIAARVVAPVFAFFVAEGMCRTRNRAAYILRMAGFGAAMQLGNGLFGAYLGVAIPNNIFLPLATGAAVVLCVDRALKRECLPLYLGLSALLLCAARVMEGGALAPLMIMIFYYFRKKRVLMYMCYILFASLLYLPQYFMGGGFAYQFFMILAVPVIMLYNGGRGPDNFAAKYFFYAFYPLHIWIIAIIKALG